MPGVSFLDESPTPAPPAPSTSTAREHREPRSPEDTDYPDAVLAHLLDGKSLLIAWRLHRKMPLSELAEAYGTTPHMIKGTEAQPYLKPKVITKLCRILHCKPKQLLRPEGLEHIKPRHDANESPASRRITHAMMALGSSTMIKKLRSSFSVMRLQAEEPRKAGSKFHDLLTVIDLNDEGMMSVTNDIHNVLAALRETNNLRPGIRVIYRDTEGVWDEVVLNHQCKFVYFRSLGGERDCDTAIRKASTMRHMQ